MNVSTQLHRTRTVTRLNLFCGILYAMFIRLKCSFMPNFLTHVLVVYFDYNFGGGHIFSSFFFFLQVLLQHAKMNGDQRLLNFYSLVASSSS